MAMETHLRVVFFLVNVVVLGVSGAGGEPAVGDPGMRRDGLRVAFEAWNFCNEVGQEAPGMGSPRAADCFDLSSKNKHRRRKHAVLKSGSFFITIPFQLLSFLLPKSTSKSLSLLKWACLLVASIHLKEMFITIMVFLLIFFILAFIHNHTKKSVFFHAVFDSLSVALNCLHCFCYMHANSLLKMRQVLF
jgi:hypothetical protein